MQRADEYTLGTWLQTWYELYAKPHLRFSTAEYYTHVTTDAQFKAAQTMGNILPRAVECFPLSAPVGGQRLGQEQETPFCMPGAQNFSCMMECLMLL